MKKTLLIITGNEAILSQPVARACEVVIKAINKATKLTSVFLAEVRIAVLSIYEKILHDSTRTSRKEKVTNFGTEFLLRTIISTKKQPLAAFFSLFSKNLKLHLLNIPEQHSITDRIER
jgi:hypothetical protein